MMALGTESVGLAEWRSWRSFCSWRRQLTGESYGPRVTVRGMAKVHFHR